MKRNRKRKTIRAKLLVISMLMLLNLIVIRMPVYALEYIGQSATIEQSIETKESQAEETKTEETKTEETNL